MQPSDWIERLSDPASADSIGEGADWVDETGWTPAHLAALTGSASAFGPLRSAGVNLNAKTTARVSHRDDRVVHPGSASFSLMVEHRWLPEGVAFDKGVQAIHIAAEFGDLESVTRLLGEKARATTGSAPGGTPLHHAARSGSAAVVSAVLGASRVKVDAAIKTRKSVSFYDVGMTPLMAACEAGAPDAVAALLEAGADLGARTKHGCTAVFFAARGGSVAVLDRMIEGGCNPAEGAEHQNWPLVEAVHGRHLAMIGRLVELGSPHRVGRRQAPMSEAYELDDDAVLDALLDAGVPAIEMESLYRAACFGSTRDVVRMLAAGADPDASEQGRTALHHAAANGKLRIAQALIDAGATVDGTDASRTPLMFAVISDHHDVARALLDGGADPTIVDVHGNQALTHTHDADTVRRMIAGGADPELPNKYGNNLMDRWKEMGLAPDWYAGD